MGNVSQTGVEPLAEAVGLHSSDVQTLCLFTPCFCSVGHRIYQSAFTQVSCLLAVSRNCSQQVANEDDGFCCRMVPVLWKSKL